MAEAIKTRALIFDAFGTLFDVRSIEAACESLFPGKSIELSRVWRSKQLEYSWLRSLMGRYADFESITADALRYSCRSMGLSLSDSNATALVPQFRRLAPFAEVPVALRALSGYKRAVLTNGSPAMIDALVANAGLSDQFDALISVDELRIFKPSQVVYELATRKLGVVASEVGFVSSNFWDIAGATAFGFRTFWVNRAGAMEDELGLHPHRVISGLDQLAQALK
ncbi:MAG TPA: haloacid dehalogenase type II [Burkholderiales bacterium]|nr:haloacid dehalogenase type II [Burkholderiales bacterium]